MKLTNREINMLGIVVVVALLSGSYYGLIDPQMKKYEELKNKQTQMQTKYEEFKKNIALDNVVYSDLSVMNNKVKDVTALFFPELRQEKFIALLVEHLKKAGVDPNSIQFNKVDKITILTPDAAKPVETGLADDLVVRYGGSAAVTPVDPAMAEKNKEKTEKMFKSVKMQQTSLTFTGSYADLINLLQQIEAYPRRITIEDVSCTSYDKQIKATVRLGYYAIPKIHKDQDADFYEWTSENATGKANPFGGSNVLKAASTGVASPTNVATNDFFLMLNPVISDLTTVIMSKMSDRSRTSYVYADNEGFEPVTFEVTQKDKKYYYHYKTSRDQYPRNYLVPVEFTPKGNAVHLQLISSKRSGPTDKSGVALTVVNATDLKLIIDVQNDDPRSRIVWAKKEGDILIK